MSSGPAQPQPQQHPEIIGEQKGDPHPDIGTEKNEAKRNGCRGVCEPRPCRMPQQAEEGTQPAGEGGCIDGEWCEWRHPKVLWPVWWLRRPVIRLLKKHWLGGVQVLRYGWWLGLEVCVSERACAQHKERTAFS